MAEFKDGTSIIFRSWFKFHPPDVLAPLAPHTVAQPRISLIVLELNISIFQEIFYPTSVGADKIDFLFWRCPFQIPLKTCPAMINSRKNDVKVEAGCHTFRIDIRPRNARKSIRRTRRRKISDYFGQNCPFWTVEKIGNTMEKSTLHIKDMDHMEIPCCVTKKKNLII